jgi:hypothetical protein
MYCTWDSTAYSMVYIMQTYIIYNRWAKSTIYDVHFNNIQKLLLSTVRLVDTVKMQSSELLKVYVLCFSKSAAKVAFLWYI